MKRKNMYIILGILAVFLLTGVVYAAIAGTLTFSGMSGFNSNVNLRIVDEEIVDKETLEYATVSPNGQTLTFSLMMNAPGDTRYVRFKVSNAGNTDAELLTLNTTNPAPNSGITVTWPEDIEGEILDAGDTSGEYTIAVHWNEAYPNATGNVNFSATIQYQQA